jgi:hypothetical protein
MLNFNRKTQLKVSHNNHSDNNQIESSILNPFRSSIKFRMTAPILQFTLNL